MSIAYGGKERPKFIEPAFSQWNIHRREHRVGYWRTIEKDFNAKLYIAYKEARETHYWLRLLKDASFVEPITADILLEQCNELLKLVGAILRTLRSR